MPGYKHPCPYCGKFIEKIVAACPFCGAVDPFAPKRCANCSKIVDDPAWVVCPSCGFSLLAPPPVADGTAAPAPAGAAAPAAQPATPAPQAAPSAPPPPAPRPAQVPAQAPVRGKVCGGCGAPLSEGARFCAICGTLAG